MIKFNWAAISRTLKTKENILRYFYNFSTQGYCTISYREEAPLDSFLLNLPQFKKNWGKYSNTEKIVYLEYASKRNLADYILNKDRGLSLDYVKDRNVVRHNRLIKIQDDKILLKYEEL